ncbi:MAG: TRAP transporter large permease subunit [Burkholderiaceae bacterium]
MIYSAAGGSVSIAALFLAGVLPGLLLGLTLAIMCLFIAKKRNFPKGETIPMRQALRICVDAMWGLMTMVIILGASVGVFHRDQSAAIAVIGPSSSRCSSTATTGGTNCPSDASHVKTLAIGMILIRFAASFGTVDADADPAKITATFTAVSDSKVVILLMINALLLVLGTLMDMAPDPDRRRSCCRWSPRSASTRCISA